MSLQTVQHSTFGKGTVIALNGKYLTVDFGTEVGEKTFVYPDAFTKFLTYDDEEEQVKVSELARQKTEQTEREALLKEEARKKAEERAEEERRKLFGKPKNIKKVVTPKRQKTIDEIVEEVVNK